MRSAVAAIVVAGSAASAGSAHADCKRVGPSTLEVTRSIGGKVTETTTLWSSGAWTLVQPAVPATREEPTPLPEARASGCLDAKVVAPAVAQNLAAIDWTVLHPKARCAASSPVSIAYATGGRHRLAQTLCGPEQLDDRSTGLLAGVVAILDAATQGSHRPERAHPVRPPSTPALPADPQQPPTEIAP
jgi:hypothetical protein